MADNEAAAAGTEAETDEQAEEELVDVLDTIISTSPEE